MCTGRRCSGKSTAAKAFDACPARTVTRSATAAKLQGKYNVTRLTSATAIGLLVLAGLNGCQTSGGLSSSTKRAMRSDLARAEQRYQQGDATGAMIACIDLARKDPLMPGLADLQVRILTSLNEQRQQANRAR